MGSSIDGIHDDYNDYKYFCEKIGVKSESLSGNNGRRNFYNHRYELLQILGFNNIEDYYTTLRIATQRDEKINSILDE